MLFISSVPTPKIGLVLGGGGTYAVACNMEILRALQDAGILDGSEVMMGTSGGAITAAARACEITVDEVLARWPAPGEAIPRTVYPSFLEHFGDLRDERVLAVASEVGPWWMARAPLGPRLLSGLRHSLADIVSASSSPRTVVAPHRIGSHVYEDAGPYSGTSAYLAPAAQLLIVVIPMIGPEFGLYGKCMEQVLAAEVRAWKFLHHGRVVVIRPPAEAAAVVGGKGFIGKIMNRDLAASLTEIIYRHGLMQAERIRKHLATIGSPAALAA
jgi:hypothetical protein